MEAFSPFLVGLLTFTSVYIERKFAATFYVDTALGKSRSKQTDMFCHLH
jgi:hypothetical protein